MPLPPIAPSGTSTAFLYGTQTSQGGGVTAALRAIPPSINAPLIFEPGPLLTSNRLDVFIVATAPQPNWGGCQIWTSADGSTYGQIGIIGKGGVQGLLTANFPSHSDPDTVDTISVNVGESSGVIVPGSTQDADLGITLSYVDGELVGYSASTLASPNNYNLDTYLRRGMFGSTIASHAIGSMFALLNGNVFTQTYPSIMIGKTIYFKFPSFNTLGAQVQDLSSVIAYPYVLTGAGFSPIPPVGTGCPLFTVLAGGANSNLGALGESIAAACDAGIIGSMVQGIIDLGVLGT
jgi:hypothetical protein